MKYNTCKILNDCRNWTAYFHTYLFISFFLVFLISLLFPSTIRPFPFLSFCIPFLPSFFHLPYSSPFFVVWFCSFLGSFPPFLPSSTLLSLSPFPLSFFCFLSVSSSLFHPSFFPCLRPLVLPSPTVSLYFWIPLSFFPSISFHHPSSFHILTCYRLVSTIK